MGFWAMVVLDNRHAGVPIAMQGITSFRQFPPHAMHASRVTPCIRSTEAEVELPHLSHTGYRQWIPVPVPCNIRSEGSEARTDDSTTAHASMRTVFSGSGHACSDD